MRRLLDSSRVYLLLYTGRRRYLRHGRERSFGYLRRFVGQPQPVYLIVDGFDRTSASYNLPYHRFAASYGQPIIAAGRQFDCADNDAIIAGALSLSEYAGVVWFLGDESVADRTFDSV